MALVGNAALEYLLVVYSSSHLLILHNILICCSAMLWDIRQCSDSPKAEPLVKLEGQNGPITLLHMDRYKIVSGGAEDPNVHVWDSDTGIQTNSLICNLADGLYSASGCCAMAVDGCKIVTGSVCQELGFLRYRDFNNSTCHVISEEVKEDKPGSKFWDSQSYDEGDESDG